VAGGRSVAVARMNRCSAARQVVLRRVQEPALGLRRVRSCRCAPPLAARIRRDLGEVGASRTCLTRRQTHRRQRWQGRPRYTRTGYPRTPRTPRTPKLVSRPRQVHVHLHSQWCSLAKRPSCWARKDPTAGVARRRPCSL
jgi:hypothetical protein